MAERETTLNEVLFIGLILNLQASAMIGLGKIVNPATQKIERSLDQARMTIDMLAMLEEKTKGNCTEEETKTFQKALTELRLNYLDELKKDHAELEKREAEKEAEAAKSEGADSEGKTHEKTETRDSAAGETKSDGETVTDKETPPQERTQVREKKQSGDGDKGEARKKTSRKARARPGSSSKTRKGSKDA